MKTSNNVSLVTFGKSVQRPEALETMPAANLMAMLQAGQWRKPIEAIRKEQNPALQKEMKQRLPYFVYGVVEGSRAEENVRQANGIVFDFDHVGDFVRAKQKLMDAAPWFRWLFRSPVDGLKLMIPFSRPVTDKAEYQMIWNLLKAEIEAKSGLKADNTPDLCRACFVSWDDDVITCPEEWLLDLDEWLAQAGVQRGTSMVYSGERGDEEIRGKGEKVGGEAGVPEPYGAADVLVCHENGAADVLVCQSPEGACEGKDKLLRSFANGDVCGSDARGDGVRHPSTPPSPIRDNSCNSWTVSSTSPDEVRAQSAVEYLALRQLDRRDWIRCGIALYNHFGEDGIVYWLQFAYNPNYKDTPDDLRKVWARLKKYPGVGLGTLFYIAEQHGWINAISEEIRGKGERVGGEAGVPEPYGAADVLVCQRPAGACEGKDKLLRSFANGDVCGSDARGDGERHPSTTPPLHPAATPSPIRDNSCNSWTDSKGAAGVHAHPSLDSSGKGHKTLDDFPELLELFRRPQNVPLDRAQLPAEIVDYLDLVGRVTDAQDGAKLTAFLPVVAANIGNRVYMYNAGTRHFCNIWAAIIGPSTVSRKTTVINQAMKMLQPFKETLADLSAKERNELDIELSRVTQARLYNLLAINPNRLILQMELSAWMREMGKSYNAGMKQEITDMFDGKDRSIAKMEIDEHIAKPAFSIVGATTEDWFFQELREVADQRGGFLQRFIICIIQNIDVNELRLESVDASDCDREIFAHHEMLQTFRDLPGSHRLHASPEARTFRDAIYKDLMTAIALNANDPQAAYCARIFDNYFWRFCVLIFLLKHWQDLREATQGVRLASWFTNNQVDRPTAEQAWYLCDYYYRNTRPFLKQLTEGSKLDEERHLLKILQKAPGQELGHSRLLCKSRMPSRDFRKCVESLIERQAIICHEDEIGYKNRVSVKYSLNPALENIDIN